jgi:hypothetical protein
VAKEHWLRMLHMRKSDRRGICILMGFLKKCLL